MRVGDYYSKEEPGSWTNIYKDKCRLCFSHRNNIRCLQCAYFRLKYNVKDGLMSYRQKTELLLAIVVGVPFMIMLSVVCSGTPWSRVGAWWIHALPTLTIIGGWLAILVLIGHALIFGWPEKPASERNASRY